jgi:hypothetical protein
LSKTSVTVILNARTYFGDSDNYFGIKLARGTSPDENLTLNLASFLPTYQAGAELQKHAFGRWLIKLDFTYAKENIQQDRFTQRLSTTVTMKTVF